MRTKNRPIDILIGVVLVYFFIGLSVISLQGLSGSPCGPVRVGGDYIYAVNRDAPRFWLTRALTWLPTAYDNISNQDVSIGEFISPQECLWVSDSGKIESPGGRGEDE
jgi:hypothetical protein